MPPLGSAAALQVCASLAQKTWEAADLVFSSPSFKTPLSITTAGLIPDQVELFVFCVRLIGESQKASE
jgi:hypothetical protein